MRCHFCQGRLIWQSDHNCDDYDEQLRGVVAVLTCTQCEAIWEGHQCEKLTSGEPKERLGPEYDEDGNSSIPYLPGKYTPGDITQEYKKYRDHLRSDEITSESKQDISNLKWYEEWKDENFTYQDPVDKDRKRYAG